MLLLRAAACLYRVPLLVLMLLPLLTACLLDVLLQVDPVQAGTVFEPELLVCSLDLLGGLVEALAPTGALDGLVGEGSWKGDAYRWQGITHT